MVMNPTVTKLDNWMTILKQMKMEALIQFFQLHISSENSIGTRNVQLWHYKGK